MVSWFEHETELRIQGEFVLRPESPTSEQVNRLTFLEEVGLIQRSRPGSGMARTFDPGANHEAAAFEGGLCLRMRLERPVKVSVIPLTRIGQEIASILPPVDPMAVRKRLGAALHNDVVSMDICRVLSEMQGGVRISHPIEVLKSAPDDPE